MVDNYTYFITTLLRTLQHLFQSRSSIRIFLSHKVFFPRLTVKEHSWQPLTTSQWIANCLDILLFVFLVTYVVVIQDH